MEKGYPLFDRGESDEAEIGFLGFVVAGGDAPPVLELAEQALDEVAPAIFLAIMRDGCAPVASGGDDRLDACCDDLRTDGPLLRFQYRKNVTEVNPFTAAQINRRDRNIGIYLSEFTQAPMRSKTAAKVKFRTKPPTRWSVAENRQDASGSSVERNRQWNKIALRL